VHLPPHPAWFWLILLSPFLAWLLAWVAVNALTTSLKPLIPRLSGGCIVFWVLYFVSDPTLGLRKDTRVVHLVLGAAAWTCWGTVLLLQRRFLFEKLRAPGSKWYLPWKSAVEFSIPTDMRVLVRSLDSVSPWYVRTLGLRKLVEKEPDNSGEVRFRYKTDGKSVVLTTRREFRANKTPILFTKKISRMKAVLTERGARPSELMRDRQGIRYFEISDPEGNKIEVVEDR
jgi:predicted enzyme related to lactoylglutathione lyase